jgi:flagellar biosynthetic protein FliR
VIDLAPLIRLGLVLVRSGTLVTTSPPFGGTYVPPTVKVGLTLLLAVSLAPLVAVPQGLTLAALATTILREAAIGLALSMAIRVTVAGAEVGGQLAGLQMGFSYSVLIDPSSGARNQVVSTLYSNLVVIALLATNAHHALLRALASSYRSLPLGAGGMSPQILTASGRMLGLILWFGVQLAAPFVIALFLVEITLALISRSVPGLNMMTIGFGLRLLVGLLVLAGAFAAVPSLTDSILQQAFGVSDLAARAFR